MKNNTYYDNIFRKILTETLEEKADKMMDKLKFNKPGSSFDYVEEGETCEQCGGEVSEGKCMECGMREVEVMEKLHGKQYKLDKNNNGKIDDEDFKLLRRKKESKEGNAFTGMLKKTPKGEKFTIGGKTYTDRSNLDEKWEGDVEVEKTGEYSDMSIEQINSAIKKLKDKTKKLQDADKPVPKKDREKMSELYFAKRAKQGWKGKGKSKVDEGVLYKLEYVNESALFTEDEIIDIIEGIIKEENNIKKGQTPAGYAAYEKSHKGSGKEEDDYLKSLTKKMKDYLKDGSKGDFDMNPKYFPKGNGELEKMKAVKYTMSDDGKDFLDDFMRPGMENLDYDEIHPDEDWMKDNIEGSSRTGNNPEWANAVETELGEKINKKRKENKYAKAKRLAYRKSKQPVTDGTGENSGTGVDIKLESIESKEMKKLNEEFDRMKKLMGYQDKTQ